jgi:hypothetical protein
VSRVRAHPAVARPGGAVTACPRQDGHGSGPFVAGACYACLKRTAGLFEDRCEPGGLTAEQRAFIGIGVATSRDPGWRPADLVCAVADREAREELGDAGRALLRALRGVGS